MSQIPPLAGLAQLQNLSIRLSWHTVELRNAISKFAALPEKEHGISKRKIWLFDLSRIRHSAPKRHCARGLAMQTL
jgi:hypothetical protein